MGLFSRWTSGTLIACILGFQLLFSLVRINEPILDGRMHWYWCNAFFLLKAKHSNYPTPPHLASPKKDFLKAFGTATFRYDENGEIRALDLYAHHPILTPALFRLYARAFGYGNWVPRSFMLILSLLTTIVLFLLLQACLKREWLSGALTLLYALLPLYFMFMDQWKDENMGTLLCLTAFFLITKVSESRAYRCVFLAVVFLLFQSAWLVYYTAPCLLLYLFVRRKESGFEGLYAWTAAVMFTSVVLNFALLNQMGFDLEEIIRAGGGRMSGGLAGIGLGEWLETQYRYLIENFGRTSIFLFLVGMAFVLLRKRGPTNLLIFASMTFVFALVCHVGIFKNLSLIHHFVQWSFGPGLILLLGGLAADIPGDLLKTGPIRALVLAVTASVLILTAGDSYRLHQGIRRSTFGKPSDLQAIRTFQKRILVFSDGRSGPENWWFSPVVEMALDPIFQGKRKKGAVQSIEALSQINPETDLLVVLNSKRALASFQKECQERFGLERLRLMERSYSFAFFDMQN